MTPTLLCLLSPYRLPTHHALQLDAAEVAAWWNGFVALWHPAAVVAGTMPKVSSPYDYETPSAGQVFAVPESPTLFLPDDWQYRLSETGAVSFTATSDRAGTVANLRDALRRLLERPAEGDGAARVAALLDAPDEAVRPFFGLGFGYMVVESLFDAMEHEHLLDGPTFFAEVRSAAERLAEGDAEGCRGHLRAAAEKLLSARETLYPMTVHLLDLALLDERRPGGGLPAGWEGGRSLNVIATARALERLAQDQPAVIDTLKRRLGTAEPPAVEICGGVALEREDDLLPVESQLWNLRRGRQMVRELLGVDVQVYARRTSAFHPLTPDLLNACGLRSALFVSLDEAVLPTYRSAVINWPAPDGKQADALTRPPLPAHNPATFFNLAFHLQETIRQDTAATVVLLHRDEPAAEVYADWAALSELAPVLGQWTTLSRYFGDAMAGEYASVPGADEFFADHLDARVLRHQPDPVSGFARQARLRRRLDAAFTLAALQTALGGAASQPTMPGLPEQLAALEDALEAGFSAAVPDEEALRKLDALEGRLADWLADRLLARSPERRPGYLLLNPCAYPRRVALELSGFAGPIPVEGPVKAAQFDGDLARLVVEVPPLGFSWFPRESPPGTPAPKMRMRLAGENTVRNEFLEAEIDPATGGLKALRDPRTHSNRLAQQLVFNPGSTVRGTKLEVTSSGPALGEIVTEGELLDDAGEVLATFRQRFRAWLGRPVLEVRIDLFPKRPPEGYAWHAYYGARFAWKDERATLLRSVFGTPAPTQYPRPVTPDFLELRDGRQRTFLLPGGLPFHQRQGGRMLDVVLVTAGETATAFDLALALDRDVPAQLAQGVVTGCPLVPVDRGPPAAGASAWLFHLDAPDLQLTSLRPAAGADRAVVAHLLQCGGFGGEAGLRCLREPRRAALVDGEGVSVHDLTPEGDLVTFEAMSQELLRLRVEW
jgi:hypothetical protein